MTLDNLLLILEIIGTIAFSVTGVITALEKKLDVFGAVVLGLCTAVGGGMMRDIILGYLPPVAFRNSVYSITAIGVAIVVYVIAWLAGRKIKTHFEVYSQVINLFDSIGLAVFTIGGINNAHACGFTDNAYLCIFVGVLTGVGGGVLRDIMAGKIPGILVKRVYAIAAITGALVYQMITEHTLLGKPQAIAIGTGVILIIRILATVFRWNLPRIKNLGEDKAEEN